MSRGIALNNPGCIRLSATHWRGQKPRDADPELCAFVGPEWGIRAAARILESYAREGVTSVQAVIARWSPPSENDTAAYVSDVCARCGVAPDAIAPLAALLKAIFWHENGAMPYPDSLIDLGIALAHAGDPDA